MNQFQIGDQIILASGGTAKVVGEFGAGGQGTVYKVEYNNSMYALKWYFPKTIEGIENSFYQNLENNIKNSSPNESFLWPLELTKWNQGSFGYLMRVRPREYEALTCYFVGTNKKLQVHFSSFTAVINAAIQIIQAFRELHNRGYSYQDINDGNFFINPTNGNVLICDNDNVSPYGINLGIMGKQRWMAPEIVTLKNEPDKQSDRFSLSVVLFRLLFINHPLEGRYSTPPCMTKELERKYYGEAPIFIYDPKDVRNRPIQGTDYNLKLFWNFYPTYLKNAFIKAFSQDVMQKRIPRILEKEWLDLFFQMKADLGVCEKCQSEMFYCVDNNYVCSECKEKFTFNGTLNINQFKLPIRKGLKIYLWYVDSSHDDFDSYVGEIIKNPKHPELLGLKNCSGTEWKIVLNSGEIKKLANSHVMPLKENADIELSNKVIAKIIK